MTKFEMMEQDVMNLLNEMGLKFDADGREGETYIHVPYVDGRGTDGWVEITVMDGVEEYEIFTQKDDDEPKNFKMLKSVKAVSTYLNNVVKSVRG